MWFQISHHPVNKLFTLPVVFAIWLAPAYAQDHTDTHRFGHAIDSLAKAAEYSGSIHVIRHGVVIHSNGYGTSCDGVVNTARTVYEIGSTSKQFTAFLIVDLMVNGKVAPEDTLGKFFEEVPDDKRSITIHQLLTHTSGLEMYHDRKGALEKMTREKALDRIFDQKLEFPPGSQYGYSNSAYTLLAIIIERVTERSFMENIKSLASEHAITIGLYGEHLWPRDSVACGKGMKREGHPYDRGEVQWAGKGAGYLMMDLLSYGIWIQTLIGSQHLEQHRKLLFTGYAVYPEVENAKYGYGWVIQEQEAGNVIYHNGGDTDLGYVTTVRYYPDMEVILIMSTNVYEDGQKLFKLKNSIRDLVRSH